MKKIILILICLVSISSFARLVTGNDHGNGGGVICINGECRTLAESGLAINPEYSNFWIPSENVLKSINHSIQGFPFPEFIRNKLRQRILLKMTHFKVVEIVDSVKLELIKQFYIDTLQNSSPGFDFTHFKIVAMSSDNSTEEQNTFLLPDFLKLSPDQQAKILIHEGLYRGHPSSDLKFIIQLESAINALQNSSTKEVQKNRKNIVTAQISAYHLNIINSSEALALIVMSTFSKIANNYLIYDLTKLEQPTRDLFSIKEIKIDSNTTKNFLYVNTEYVQSNSDLDARTAVLLLNLEPVPLETKKYSFPGLNYSFNLYCDNEWGFRLTYKDRETSTDYKIEEPEKLKLLLPQ